MDVKLTICWDFYLHDVPTGASSETEAKKLFTGLLATLDTTVDSSFASRIVALVKLLCLRLQKIVKLTTDFDFRDKSYGIKFLEMFGLPK